MRSLHHLQGLTHDHRLAWQQHCEVCNVRLADGRVSDPPLRTLRLCASSACSGPSRALLVLTLVAGIGGLLFGYDTVECCSDSPAFLPFKDAGASPRAAGSVLPGLTEREGCCVAGAGVISGALPYIRDDLLRDYAGDAARCVSTPSISLAPAAAPVREKGIQHLNVAGCAELLMQATTVSSH